MKRILTGLVLAPIIAYSVLWGPALLFLAVLSVIAVFCFWEYRGLVAAHGFDPPGVAGFAAGLVVLLAPLNAIFPVILALLFLALVLRLEDLAKALPSAGSAILGILYVFGGWRTARELRDISVWWLFLALSLNWVGDTMAYYTGRAFGRHKMAPSVSPGKTWEGAAGSVVASVAYAVVYAHFLLPGVSALESILVGLIGNVAGQVGDLVESALKRGCGVKDSGNLLPGHGGWLDRVDSSLFSVPAVYLLVNSLNWR